MKKWVAIAAVAVVAAVPFALVHRVRVAEDAWARTFGPIEGEPAKYRAKRNGKEPMLAAWSARVTPSAAREKTAIYDYLYAEMASTADRARPNPFVLHYRAAEVDAFANWIGDEPPVFSRVLTSPGASVPNLFPVLQLQKTMLAAAMARVAANDQAGAERLLDASWRLNESLSRGPTLIERLIAAAVYRFQLGVLRKADFDAAKWVPRIRSADTLASIAEISRMESWYRDRAVRENLYASDEYLRDQRSMHAAMGDGQPFKPQWLQMLRTPVRWFDLPSTLEGDRAMLVAVRTAHRSEFIDRELDKAWDDGAKTWWSVPDPDIEKVNWATAFRRAVRTDAEGELTQKVLLARAGKFEGSSSIANAHWVRDGNTIRLSRPINWRLEIGVQVPMQHAVR